MTHWYLSSSQVSVPSPWLLPQADPVPLPMLQCIARPRLEVKRRLHRGPCLVRLPQTSRWEPRAAVMGQQPWMHTSEVQADACKRSSCSSHPQAPTGAAQQAAVLTMLWCHPPQTAHRVVIRQTRQHSMWATPPGWMCLISMPSQVGQQQGQDPWSLLPRVGLLLGMAPMIST